MKIRLCIALSVFLMIISLALPVSAGEPLALQIEQTQICEPGENVVLAISLPDTELAGGFVCVQYDHSLLTLTDVTLLQATETLHLTYAQKDGKLNILLDGAQNAQVSGQLIALTFATSEEIQPGTYPVTCIVPDPASFYTLDENGNTHPLNVVSVQGKISVSTPVLPPCPARYLACQETAPVDGSVRVRVCALIQDGSSPALGSYGFTITVTDQNGTHEITQSGSKLADQIDGGSHTYTAEELGGSVYTLILEIPAQGQVSITIAPYAKLDGHTLYGGTYTVTYLDGVYVGTTQ